MSGKGQAGEQRNITGETIEKRTRKFLAPDIKNVTRSLERSRVHVEYVHVRNSGRKTQARVKRNDLAKYRVACRYMRRRNLLTSYMYIVFTNRFTIN